ncbi:MAG: hypothetical protein ACOYUZ_03275 [Patescibacteria group bacterium]
MKLGLKMCVAFLISFSFLLLGAAPANAQDLPNRGGRVEDRRPPPKKADDKKPAPANQCAIGEECRQTVCDMQADCAKRKAQQNVTQTYFQECRGPKLTVVERGSDGLPVTKVIDGEGKLVNGKCECPAGFYLIEPLNIPRTYSVSKRDAETGTVTTTRIGRPGWCAPMDPSISYKVLPEIMRDIMLYIAKLRQETGNQIATLNGDVINLKATVAGQGADIALNRAGLNAVMADQAKLSLYVKQNVEPAIEKLRNEIRNRWHANVGAAGQIGRMPERTHGGAGVEASLITPRLGGSVVRVEIGGRAIFGTSQRVDNNGSSNRVANWTLYGGPAFELDDDGVWRLHTRAYIQQMDRERGPNHISRSVGGEAALSVRVAPNVRLTPHFGVGAGRSVIDREDHPELPGRKKTGTEVHGGLTVGVEF